MTGDRWLDDVIKQTNYFAEKNQTELFTTVGPTNSCCNMAQS